MRIVQTVASTRLDHGGTSRSVPALCEALVLSNVDVHLITALPSTNGIHVNLLSDATRNHLCQENPLVRQWGVAGGFRKYLHQLSKNPSQVVVHDHAIWLPTNHAVASECRRLSIPRVVSPRGMLGDWAMNHGRWKKKLAWFLFQKRDLQTATAFHSTSDQESQEIRALGFKQPIAMVPNGLTLPERMPDRNGIDDREYRTALFLSRVHPKKGLEDLLHAWAATRPSHWRLRIVGPGDESYRVSLVRLVEQLSLHAVVEFVDEVNDQAKWTEYAQADLFVLPSKNENFGLSIAEAMAAGTPVLTTTGTPWKTIQDKSIGWWVAPSRSAIQFALQQATSTSPSQLQAMGQQASQWVTQTYSWHAAAKQLTDFYHSFGS